MSSFLVLSIKNLFTSIIFLSQLESNCFYFLENSQLLPLAGIILNRFSYNDKGLMKNLYVCTYYENAFLFWSNSFKSTFSVFSFY